MQHFKMTGIKPQMGFSMENAQKGAITKILVKYTGTSDDASFYGYINQLAGQFLNPHKLLWDSVNSFLVVIHENGEADVYVNLSYKLEIKAKKSVEAGQIVSSKHIADIRQFVPVGVEVKENDNIILCFQINWRFALFFDFTRLYDKDPGNTELFQNMGSFYKSIKFDYLYKSLANQAVYQKMLKDGWFLFIELVGAELPDIVDLYKNDFNYDERLEKILNKFDEKRIGDLSKKWWQSEIFKDKQTLIQAGIDAYSKLDAPVNVINAMNSLIPQIEGVLRFLYEKHGGTVAKPHVPDLLTFLRSCTDDATANDSLLLPIPFIDYLDNVYFAGFDIKEEVEMSRHSQSHGVVSEDKFTKSSVIQSILILDQLYFYVSQVEKKSKEQGS